MIKLDPTLTKENETNLDNNFNLSLNSRKKKDLARWPIFIIILSAITCLSFSATFHLYQDRVIHLIITFFIMLLNIEIFI